MNLLSLEEEIFLSVHGLSGHQKTDVLDYIKNIKPKRHSVRLYRNRAMKQIREALSRS